MVMKEITLNFVEMTPAQYGRHVGIGKAAAIKRCEQGLVPAYKTDGGHWKIKVYKEDTYTKEDYEALKTENEGLKLKLDMMRKLLT